MDGCQTRKGDKSLYIDLKVFVTSAVGVSDAFPL